MKRKLIFLTLLFAFTFYFVPLTLCDGEEWETTTGTAVKLGRKQYLTSVFTPQLIDGDWLSLPTDNPKGLRIRFVKDTIYVDKNGSGKADFVAVKKESSKVFSVTLTYSDGEKVTHSFAFYQRGVKWGLERQSGMKFTIAGAPVLFSDENNNGIYGEVGVDGVFVNGKNYGSPLGDLILLGDSVYEVRLNGSGTEAKYKKIEAKTGKIDVTSNWGGKSKPSCIVAKAKLQSGSGYFDIDSGEVSLPLGSYQIQTAYLPDVEVDARQASLSFSVTEGENTAPSWGQKLRVSISVSYDSKKEVAVVSPPPTVSASSGEIYKGLYISTDKFKAKVRLATANGKAKGKTIKWGMSKTGGGGGWCGPGTPTRTEWQRLEVRGADKAEAILITCKVPGVGEATGIFPYR